VTSYITSLWMTRRIAVTAAHRCRAVCRGMARDVTVMPSHRSRCQCHCSRAMYVVLLSMYADVSGSGLDTVLP
jgi:hypothetical protein